MKGWRETNLFPVGDAESFHTYAERTVCDCTDWQRGEVARLCEMAGVEPPLNLTQLNAYHFIVALKKKIAIASYKKRTKR